MFCKLCWFYFIASDQPKILLGFYLCSFIEMLFLTDELIKFILR